MGDAADDAIRRAENEHEIEAGSHCDLFLHDYAEERANRDIQLTGDGEANVTRRGDDVIIGNAIGDQGNEICLSRQRGILQIGVGKRPNATYGWKWADIDIDDLEVALRMLGIHD